MNSAAQFLDAAAKPLQLILSDAVVLRLCRAVHYAEWAREPLLSNSFALIGSA
ncbi:hypothetical protein GCM10011393_34840 [Sphingopyxis bauzanensis]|nr:hypothetical protein GCM10011393_34840 [Sphingopyxis bauzanensis]